MRFSLSNIATAAVAVLYTTATPSVGASPPSGRLEARQDAKPEADYCCCGAGNNYNCKVPHAEGGAEDPVCTLQLCPHDPETEDQCCCCDPDGDPWTVTCKTVPKGAGCGCTTIYCPFRWGEQYLPGYPWTTPS